MIKNVIFDIGNVLFDYCWLKPLEQYGLTAEKAEEIDRMVLKDEIWSKYDNGLVTHQEAKAAYAKKYPKVAAYTNHFFDNMHWINIPRQDVWDMIPGLKKKGYGIYVLSNYPKELFFAHTKNASFLRELDGGVVSYQVNVGKPDARIYNILLQKHHLKAEECIFYDDKKENIETAVHLGFEGVVIHSKEQLIGELNKL